MTGFRPDEDEESDRLIIHWDGGTEAAHPPSDAPEEEPEPDFRPSLLQRYRYWLYALAMFLVLGGAGYFIGDASHNPPPRLPALAFGTDDSFFGTNAPVADELDMVRESFSTPEDLALEPSGNVFRLPLPRTLGDRLFGERDEAITIFVARGPAEEFRFLTMTGNDGERFWAIEAPLGLSRSDQPNGVYLALDPADPVLGPLVAALDGLLPALDDLPEREVSSDGFYAFGPYQAGDAATLRARIAASTVMMHLKDGIEAVGGEVSVAAPVLIIGSGPSRGTINAIYHPARRVVMEPLWGAASTASLAHELVHAYLDTVVTDREAVLTQAANYLERAHPVLHGEVVGDLYQRLGREGRAEESLAFITGAIAAGQTKTVATQRLLENTGNLSISEAILYSDVDLLIEFGLLPACMRPAESDRGEITSTFYDRVEVACRG